MFLGLGGCLLRCCGCLWNTMWISFFKLCWSLNCITIWEFYFIFLHVQYTALYVACRESLSRNISRTPWPNSAQNWNEIESSYCTLGFSMFQKWNYSMILLSMSSGICSTSGECYDYDKAEPNFEQYEFQTRSCLKFCGRHGNKWKATKPCQTLWRQDPTARVPT